MEIHTGFIYMFLQILFLLFNFLIYFVSFLLLNTKIRRKKLLSAELKSEINFKTRNIISKIYKSKILNICRNKVNSNVSYTFC